MNINFENHSVEIPDMEYLRISDNVAAAVATVSDASDIMEEDTFDAPISLPGRLYKHSYMPWGRNNKMPYNIIEKIGIDEVMSQNKHFNVITCYADGLRVVDDKTGKKTTNKEIKKFLRRNNISSLFLEMITDLKYFSWAFVVFILDREGKHITEIRHKDVSNIRLAQAKDGKIKYAYYGPFNNESTLSQDTIEVIPLLDINRPYADMEIKLGKAPGPDGIMANRLSPTERKFGCVIRFPMPGCRYYPIPYYASIFRGDWYDIKRLISTGKKANLRNHAPIKYMVTIDKQYWLEKYQAEGILDNKVKQKEFMKRQQEEFKTFLTGIENGSKAWITGNYRDPAGNSNPYIKVEIIDSSKQGGDWSEEVVESTNMICYADGIHPNLVGAVPGKTQSNNSGSDKRELFTLKQSTEKPPHDLLSIPFEIVLMANDLEDDYSIDVPIITLTTLDENKDSKKVTLTEPNNKD